MAFGEELQNVRPDLLEAAAQYVFNSFRENDEYTKAQLTSKMDVQFPAMRPLLSDTIWPNIPDADREKVIAGFLMMATILAEYSETEALYESFPDIPQPE